MSNNVVKKTNQDIAIELSRGLQGGFMASLGDAYCRADSGNRKRLELGFPHVFNSKEPGAETFEACVLAVGNLFEGVEMVGPFSTPSEAIAHGGEHYPGAAWVVGLLTWPGEG